MDNGVDLQFLMSSLTTAQEQLEETERQLQNAQTELNSAQDQLQTTQLYLDKTKPEFGVCKILSLANQSDLFENPALFYKNRIYFISVHTQLNITIYKVLC